MSATIPKQQSNELAEQGWRMEIITNPDGTTDLIQIPLTEEEFLHPKEGYYLPNSTFHDNTIADVKDMLTRRYANDAETAVFSDLLIKWDVPNLGDHSPDICVVFGIQDKQKNRTDFVVAQEGVRPALVIEVVSPRYRKTDRETKVIHYARGRVQEYIIIDQRRQRGQLLDEVLGYRLIEGQYMPITPDEEGWVFCQTVGLWITLQEGRIVMRDGQTGERLLTSVELKQQASQAELRAIESEQRAIESEQRAIESEQRAIESEQRASRLAELLRSQGIDPEQI